MRTTVYVLGTLGIAVALWALSNIVAWQLNISAFRASREPLIVAFYLLLVAFASILATVTFAWLSRKSLHRADSRFVWGVLVGFVAIALALFAVDGSAA
jgi:hypothetical protein